MKSLTRSELIKRIDRLFQTCRRYDGAWKKNGIWYNKCVTSGQTLPLTKMDAGHWIPRGCYATRWNPTNCNPQSKHDNCFRNGAYIEYSNWYLKTYGKEKYEQMIDTYERHKQGKIPPFKMPELKRIYDEWLEEGRKLEKKTGLELFPKSWQPFGEDYIEI